MEVLSSENNLKQCDGIIPLEKPRLQIFKTITKKNTNIHSTLVDDIRVISNDLINDNSSISYKSNYVMDLFHDENDIENLLSKEEEEYLCRMLNL